MKRAKEGFVHMHTHSDMSQLDGCGKISEFVSEAKARGNPAIAFTEHGTQRGYLELQKQADSAGIKPIYGIEFYVSPDMHRKGVTPEEREDIIHGLKKTEQRQAIKDFEEREGIRDRWHTTVWAMTDEGMRNLQRLSSAAYIDGFYYKPRVDLEALCSYNEGLAISTGCLSGPAHDAFLRGKKRWALRFVDRLHESYGDRLYLEVQPHAIKDQMRIGRFALTLKDRFPKAKLLATQDAHYVYKEDHAAHDLLLCIGTGAKLTDADRFRFDGDEFFFRTRKQMRSAFSRHHAFLPTELVKEALDSTVELAERCNVKIEIDYLKATLPNPGLPKKYGDDDFGYLKDLCLDGWTWRGIPARAREYARKHGGPAGVALQVYVDRLKKELRALKKQRFVLYFLVVHDLYKFVRGEGIMCGPGRGSAGGSLISFLLGITSVDPIEHGLLFERFINPDRLDLPDVDMDFEDARRKEVIDYLIRKYGRDNVCQIATIGRLSGKQCLRDVSRVLGVPLPEVNMVAPSIIERPDGHPREHNTIEDSFKEFPVCRDFDERHPEVLEYASKLEGMAKQIGIHAAGVVTSPTKLTEIMPLEIRKHKGEDIIVSAVGMNEVASIGLVKLDILGLRTLTVIRNCLDAIKERHGLTIDMERIDMNDPKVLQGFTDHDYGGVFQYDTPSAYKICRGVVFEDFEDIAAMTALNRPGATRSGLSEQYLARKKNKKKRGKVDYHPIVNEICADTLGVIVYQEHCIKIFTELAGFSPGKADTLRKAIGKKKAEVLKKARGDFVAGCKAKHGIEKKIAEKVYNAIEAFGAYGFNKSHATEYAAIAYWCMYLKTYYPTEFFWALMLCEPDRQRIKQIAKDTKSRGIQVLPPHVSVSRDQFSIDPDGHIRGSLVDIKGVGQAAAKTVMDNQPFKNFVDFATRVDRRLCHRGVVVALLSAGAFKGLVPNQKFFETNLPEFWNALKRKTKRKATIREFWRKAMDADDHTEEERKLIAARVNPLAFGSTPLEAYESFIEDHVGVKLTRVEGDNFWTSMDGRAVYIAGLLMDARTHQVGDFHTGDLPTEEDRRRQFWGARYANVNIEGMAGSQYRVKFDIDIFEAHREIIDAEAGTPVVMHCTVDGRYERFKAHYAIDLERYRLAVRSGGDRGFWGRLVAGEHPARDYPWKDKKTAKRRRMNVRFNGSSSGGLFTGVVTHVRLKYDSKGRQMAFFGLLGERGYIDVIAFSSVWVDVRKAIKRGRLMSMPIDKVPDEERGVGFFFSGGPVKVLKRSAGWTFPK